VLAHQHLAEAKPLHDLSQHQRAAADHVDPARVHHGQLRPLGPGLHQQARGHLANRRRADPGVVDPLGLIAVQPEHQRGDGGHRTGQADQGARGGHRDLASDHVEGGIDVGARRRELVAAGRVVVQVPLGHPDAADVHAYGGGHRPGLTEHELGRAATYVGDQVWGVRVTGQFGSRAGKRQARLVLAAEHLRLDAEYVADACDELAGVGRVPGGAGGHHPHGRRRCLGDDLPVGTQRPEGPGQRLGTESPDGVHALAEPHDLQPPVHIRQPARGPVHVRHQKPYRVRAAVDRRHAHHGPAAHAGPPLT
jgi:hypothetical protein